MTKYVINKSSLVAIADEVRELNESEAKVTVEEMITTLQEANEEIAVQTELLTQAVEDLKGKADPELYDKGYIDGYSETLDQIIGGTVSGEITTSVAIVRTGAFWSCPITKAELPNATSIGRDAFRNTNLVSISAPNVMTIGSYSMQACNNLVSVDFPKVEKLGGYTLQSCGRLTDVNMPSLTTLTTADMYGCSSLERLDLPALTSIGHSVFVNCSKLASLILRNETTVCTLEGSGSFAGTPIANGTGYIYVPDNLAEQYKTETNWSVFAEQIKIISELEEGA